VTDWPSDTLPQRLQHWALTAPDRLALVDADGSTWTYGALAREIQRWRSRLLTARVGPGDRVVSLQGRHSATVAAMWASWSVGAAWAPLADTVPLAALTDHLARLRPKALLLAADEPARRVLALSQGAAVLHGAPLEDDNSRTTSAQGPNDGQPALAAILHTSGSRGEPKGVMLSHGNLAFTAAAITHALGLRSDDRVYCALPLHHSYGLYQLWCGLGLGACVVLGEAANLGARMAQQFNLHQGTVLPATPGLLRLLLQRHEPAALPNVRLITQAADSLTPQEAQRVRSAWPQARLVRMYGLTECGRVSIETDNDRPAWDSCVGRPLLGTRVCIVGDHGERLPTGNAGRLWVQGPHVMQGYWEQPQATARALVTRAGHDGPPGPWLDTGDIVMEDSDGCLHFQSRDADRLKCRGERVSANSVREAVMAHPAVLDCAVIGRPHPALGQQIEAHVVLHDGHDCGAAALAEHCRERLEPAHCPQRFQFWPALPKNELGKVSTMTLLARGP
jgi:acyl-coenzyme A synthetase/AMP-(fatty) acid ligase